MKKVVKKLLGYLMTLVLVIGMFSGVPVKAATVSEGDKTKINFEFLGPDTIIKQYVTEDGNIAWLLVDNELYSYSFTTGEFTLQETFGVPVSITTSDATAATIEGQDVISAYINKDTGLLYYAYNEYSDAYTENQTIYINICDLENYESSFSVISYKKASLSAVAGDDDGNIFIATNNCYDDSDNTYSIIVYPPMNYMNHKVNTISSKILEFVDYRDGTMHFVNKYIDPWGEEYTTCGKVSLNDDLTIDNYTNFSTSVSYPLSNTPVEINENRYLTTNSGIIIDLVDTSVSTIIKSRLTVVGNNYDNSSSYTGQFGSCIVVMDGIAYCLVGESEIVGYSLSDWIAQYQYTCEDHIFNISNCGDGLLLMKRDDNNNYWYVKLGTNDMTVVETIDINKQVNYKERTKEAIVKKFADATLDSDYEILASEGSVVAPYKEYTLTSEAKTEAINVANYYRYLMGAEEAQAATDDVWTSMAKGMIVCGKMVDEGADFEYFYTQPDDMDYDFWYEGAGTISASTAGAYETFELESDTDILHGFRNMMNISPEEMASQGADGTYGLDSTGITCPYAEELSVAVDNDLIGCWYSNHDNEKLKDDIACYTWPSAGYFPVEEIERDSCWGVIVNSNVVNKIGGIAVYDCSSEQIVSQSTCPFAVPIYYFSAPEGTDSYEGKKYRVELHNVEMEDGTVCNMSYTVEFFSYEDQKITVDNIEYTCDEGGVLKDANGKTVAENNASSGSDTGNEGGNLDGEEAIFVAPDIDVSYRTHIQTFGWEGTANDITTWKSNGTTSGTFGLAKRLEGINLVVNPATTCEGLDLGIQYTTHCQTYGWLPWSADGDMNGTEGEAKRLEAIKIQLTGEHADLYDVYYRVHAQTYGWLGWAKNGAPAGTAGYAKRLEGIQIVVVKKGESFDQKMENITSARTEAFVAKEGSSPIVNHEATSNTNPVVPGAEDVNVAYRTHVQSFGWQAWKYNGQMSGTSGQAKRLEGINIELRNKDCSGDIVYTTHVQTYGWQGSETDQSKWFKNGQMAGTSGEAKRLEAICIDLTGEMAANYDIYYRVHAQTYGWLGWAKNGAPAGTAGYAKRLEGIQIVLVPKNGAAPGDYQGIKSVRAEAYVSK